MTATAPRELQAVLWLERARQQAWSAFHKTPPPSKAVETWRRVDFNAWRLSLFADGEPAPLLGSGEGPIGPIALSDEAGIFLQKGNGPWGVSLDPELARQGVLLMSLEDAAMQHPNLVGPQLQSANAGIDFRNFETANLAQFSGGVFLYVPKGLRVEKPFDLSFLQTTSSIFSFPRVLVIVEEGAEATIVEGYRKEESALPGSGSKFSSIAFSQVIVEAGAKVRYFYDQSLPLETTHLWHQRLELAQDAILEHYSVLLGSAVHKSELDVRLNGKGAHSKIRGILFGNKNQLFDPHTAQWHSGPKSISDLLFRVALKDRARAIYTGLIRIEKDAGGCDAYQQNNNLLLSNNARADTTPILEILTDDVRCKHGATIGPVNPDELFYLCSRGLSPEEATRILILGFFDPILSKLPLGHLHDRITEQIEQRLES